LISLCSAQLSDGIDRALALRQNRVAPAAGSLVPFGIALKYDHLHGLLAPNMLLSHPKLIANPLFKHCDGLFGMAMKAKGFVVKGGGKVWIIRSIGTHETQKDQLLLFWVPQIALCL